MKSMIQIDRPALKANAKQLMAQTAPAVWLVTLIYLLISDWLPQLCQTILPGWGQFQEAYGQMMTGDVYVGMETMDAFLTSSTGLTSLFSSIVISLVCMVLSYGYTGYAMAVSRGQQVGLGEPYSRFYMAGKIIAAELLTLVYVFLWSLLLVIPGIIAAYHYRMVPYLLLDAPEMSISEAFRQSKQMMMGRKGELFELDLSFFGWAFLVNAVAASAESILLGLGAAGGISGVIGNGLYTACMVFLLPYMELTLAQWYDAVLPGEE